MSKILNDAIHGTIELDPLLIKIIDTPQFQRLRNIKQLGGCYFVYPSASHNRFEHSIGTCFLAGQMACQLQKRLDRDIEMLGKDKNTKKYAIKLKEAKMTEDDKLCIEIAGLCHDIGHGPYSHLFDVLFMKAMKEKDPQMKKWTHEYVSRKMIDYMMKENKELATAFKDRFPKDWVKRKAFIKDLIDGEKTKRKTKDKARSYMYEIVANKRNAIDVDKMDYFARDCHGLGMKSNFDHLRFISQCRVMFSSDIPDETTIAVRDKEEHNLYELFHTRIGLFRRAYYHKVNKAVELMFTDALVKANDHLLFKNKNGKKIKMSAAYEHPEVYEKLTDNVFDTIVRKEDQTGEMKKAQELINNVYTRKLYKLVDDTSAWPVKEFKTDEDKTLKTLLLDKGLTEDDFAVQKVDYSYGKGTKNPITLVYFYTKDNDTDCFLKTESKETSLFLPEIFQEQVLRVYAKNNDKIKIKRLTIETTKYFKMVRLALEEKASIELKKTGSAAPERGTKRKLNAEGKRGPSSRPTKKRKH